MADHAAPLAARSCTPCRGGVPPLTLDEAAVRLAEVPGWSLHDEAHRIERRFAYKTFAASYAFVQQVAALAEAEGHHPDIGFGWGYATISLTTHAIKGLHDNDFIMAAKVNEMVG